MYQNVTERELYLDAAGERTHTVLQAIESSFPALVSVPELVATTGIERHALSNSLTRLLRHDLIERPYRGKYLAKPVSQIAQPCVCRCCDH